MILLPSRQLWTKDNLPDRPLELDTTFPYFGNLKLAYFFHDRRKGYNLADRVQATVVGSPLTNVAEYGWCESLDSNFDYFDTNVPYSGNEWTFLLFQYPRTLPDGGATYLALSQEDNLIRFSWDHGSSTYRGTAYFKDSGGTYRIAKFNIGSQDIDRWGAYVGRAISGTGIWAFKHGILEEERLTSGTFRSPSGDMKLGSSMGQVMDTNICACCVWNAALPDALIWDISQNPFILLRHPRRWVPVSVPAAGITRTVSDVGAGADQLGSLAVSLSVSDTAAGTDSPMNLAVSLALTETGAGVDAIALISVLASVADSGGGVDSVAQMLASLTVADAGAGLDSPDIAAALSIADVGAGSDSQAVTVALSVSDTGTGADAVSVLTEILKTISDVATGSDAIGSITASLSVTDVGAGTDVPTIGVSLAVADVGTGTEVLNIIQAVLKTISDAGTGADSIGPVTVSLAVSDVGAGLDVIGAISALLAIAEAAGGSDAVTAFDSEKRIASITFTLQKRSITQTFAKREIDITLQ